MKRRTWINFIRRSIIDPVTNCWNWSGPVDKDGYAHYRYERGYPTFLSFSSAYRLCYRIMKGIIPDEYTVDHHGHEYTPDNIYWRLRMNGTHTRVCKQCSKERNGEAYQRRVSNGTT